MTIHIDLPEESLDTLEVQSQVLHLSPEQYAAEILRAHLATQARGDEGRIENRQDWQDAIESGRADILAGRVVADNEVEQWHLNHLESSGL